MVEQFNPTQYNPQEFLATLQEIGATMDRILVDIHTPAHDRKFKNLFTAKTNQTAGKYLRDVLDGKKFTPTDRLILDQAKDLTSNRFPEMIFMYRKTSKKDKLPEDPNEFFETVKNAPTWVKHRVNIDPKQIQSVQEKVASQQATSQINLSPMWLFGQLLALSEIGLNIVSPEDYKKEIKKFGHQAEQLTDTTAVIGESVLCLIRTYFHPKTVEALSQFIQSTSISNRTGSDIYDETE